MTTASSCSIPANPSPELQAALTWIDGLNRWDIDHLLSPVSDDYMHHVLPESLGIKPRSKEDFREYFTTILPMFQGFTVTLHEIVEAPGRIFFHATSKATSTTGFPYANEYNVLLHLAQQPSGPPKISVAKEFVDSKYSAEFFAAERLRQAALDRKSFT